MRKREEKWGGRGREEKGMGKGLFLYFPPSLLTPLQTKQSHQEKGRKRKKESQGEGFPNKAKKREKYENEGG